MPRSWDRVKKRRVNYKIWIHVLIEIILIGVIVFMIFFKDEVSNIVDETNLVDNDLENTEQIYVKVNEKNDYSLTSVDTRYKLFFGEWEVTKIIAEHQRFGGDENAEDLLGTVFYYNHDIMKKDDLIISNAPIYRYYVLPASNARFLQGMPLPSEIGINGDFWVYIEIKTEDIFQEGTSFYIKDDETLIFYDNNVFYEVKRKSYIEQDISVEYEHI